MGSTDTGRVLAVQAGIAQDALDRASDEWTRSHKCAECCWCLHDRVIVELGDEPGARAKWAEVGYCRMTSGLLGPVDLGTTIAEMGCFDEWA